jgi:dTDP-4-dehydrorhamnose 3,5-epimerase
MDFIKTTLEGVILLKPKIFGDERGFFLETYQLKEFKAAGIPWRFVQDNYSGSRQGILRGLHYQICQTQGKLVRVVVGEAFDVAVDIRRSSPNFGCWVGEILSAENKHQLWIPPGFAHAFYALSIWVEVTYKATDYYAPEWERSIFWNDPGIGINWPLIEGQPPILSEKDKKGFRLCDAPVFE